MLAYAQTPLKPPFYILKWPPLNMYFAISQRLGNIET